MLLGRLRASLNLDKDEDDALWHFIVTHVSTQTLRAVLNLHKTPDKTSSTCTEREAEILRSRIAHELHSRKADQTNAKAK
jgi:hypothetical protein